jgi:hypothetical protein
MVAVESEGLALGKRPAKEERESYAMPLFMDHHRHVEGLSADAVADAHRKDEQIQDEYGVTYLKYWFNEATGEVSSAWRRRRARRLCRGGAPRGPRPPSRRDNRGHGGRGL